MESTAIVASRGSSIESFPDRPRGEDFSSLSSSLSSLAWRESLFVWRDRVICDVLAFSTHCSMVLAKFGIDPRSRTKPESKER